MALYHQQIISMLVLKSDLSRHCSDTFEIRNVFSSIMLELPLEQFPQLSLLRLLQPNEYLV